MKKQIQKAALLFITLVTCSISYSQVSNDWGFDTDGDLESFSTTNKTSETVAGGFLTVVPLGTKNNLELRRSNMNVGDPASITTVIIDVQNSSSADEMEIRKGTTVVATTTITSGDAAQKSYRVDISDAAWVGDSFQMRIRFKATSGNITASAIIVDRIQVVNPATLNVTTKDLEGVSVYPNPVKNQLKINSPNGGIIKIYNVLGGVVKNVKTSSALQNIIVSDLESGLYFVEVESEGKVFKTKLIKS